MSLHRHLRDPLYIGKFIYKGKLHKGNHPPMMTDEEFSLLQDILDGNSKPRPQKYNFALNEIIKCGECQYCITAEAHTKKYRNGTSQIFTYYRCTKKSRASKCSQGYIREEKLEDQALEELGKFELDPEF